MLEQTKAIDLLVCPETKQRLHLCSCMEAEQRMGARLTAFRKGAPMGEKAPPFGVTDQVLLREDLQCAYPVVDGIPILMVPEMLGPAHVERRFDLKDPKYAEAYEEMAFYNETASQEAEHIRDSESYHVVAPVVQASQAERQSFPEPRAVWLDAVYECAAQWDAYQYIAPIRDKRVLQLGGKGLHAVKFLLGGAAEAWVVTPMLGEVRCAMALAREVGVLDRLRYVVAVAEELPLQADSIDVIYSGGCMHHMTTEVAVPEAARVLKPGGRFAATDPWRAPLYAVGTKLLGKREPDVFCRPLTRERVAPVSETFRASQIVQHGTLTRYPLLALNKFGVPASLQVVWYLNALDDMVCSLVPGLRDMGSSVVCLGTK